MAIIEINKEFIKLQAFLKLADIIGQGSDCKLLLSDNKIKVNGAIAVERGKKIRDGDVVEFEGNKFVCRVIAYIGGD